MKAGPLLAVVLATTKRQCVRKSQAFLCLSSTSAAVVVHAGNTGTGGMGDSWRGRTPRSCEGRVVIGNLRFPILAPPDDRR